MLSGWGGGGGGGEELELLELVVSASFSELSLSDASSSTHILTAAPCLVTALLGLSNNIHVHFRFNARLSPTGFINTAPFRLISPCSRTFFLVSSNLCTRGTSVLYTHWVFFYLEEEK